MHILMTTGGSLHSETALWLGAEIATLTSSTPTILIVIDSEEGREHADKVLKRAGDIVTRVGSEAQTKIRIGKPKAEILAETMEGDYDLLVLGTHAAEGWSRYLLADITAKVVEGIGRPVLVMR